MAVFDVIKFENNENVLVYKYPKIDFNFGSQLIVHESQEAIFFEDGQALGSYKAGAYTLDTENFPFLTKTLKKLASNQSVFHSEIYFIDLTTKIGIKWGTDSKVRFFDPVSGMHIEIGASGTFNLKVIDGRKLLLKIVGTSPTFNIENVFDSVGISSGTYTNSFKGMIIQKVKITLAKLLKEMSINILEVDEYLGELSQKAKDVINKDLENYGVCISEFYITNILTPDDDPNYKKMKAQYAERYLKIRQQNILKEEATAAQEVAVLLAETNKKTQIIKAQAEAESELLRAKAHGESLKAQGASYNMETARIVGTKAAENESQNGSSIVSDLISAGVGFGIGSHVVNNVMDNVSSGLTWTCKKCGHSGNKGNFCENCGQKKENN